MTKVEEFKQKKVLQMHRFECMSKVHSQKEDLRTKTHRERLNESANRLLQAQQMHSNTGTFPGIGGGCGSIQSVTNLHKNICSQQTANLPAVYVPGPTQMVPSFLSSIVANQPMTPSPISSTSTPDNDLLPDGWSQFIDPHSGSPIYIHESGKRVFSRLEIYATQPLTGQKPVARVFPEKVGSALPRIFFREGLGSSAEKPIEVLSENEEDEEEKVEESDFLESSLIYGRQESSEDEGDSDSSSATQLQN